MASGKWSGQRRPYSKQWHRVRALVKRRSAGVCEYTEAGIRCTAPGRDVDHITPVYLGGTDTLDNARLLCPPHHRIKTQAESTHSRTLIRRRIIQEETHPFDSTTVEQDTQ